MPAAFLLVAVTLASPFALAESREQLLASVAECRSEMSGFKVPESRFCESRGPSKSYLENALGMHQRLLGLGEVKASYQAFLDGLESLEKSRQKLCRLRDAKGTHVTLKPGASLPQPGQDSCSAPELLSKYDRAGKDLLGYLESVKREFTEFERDAERKHDQLGRAALDAVGASQYSSFRGHLERELTRNNLNRDRFREGLNAYERVLDQFYLERDLMGTHRGTLSRGVACLEKIIEACNWEKYGRPEGRPFGE